MKRSFLLLFLITLIGFIYIGRLFQLQVLRKSDNNPIQSATVKIEYDYPERGYIFDRNNKLLVANQLSYDVMIIPKEVKTLDTLQFCSLLRITKEDFIRILKEPKNALTKQYAALIGAEDVEITFKDDAMDEIAEMAFNINAEIENIGARRLHTVMSRLLNDILFDIPDIISANAKIVITKKDVTDKLSDMVQNKDLSEFIL